ncbi:hypothetical protein EMIHUDRAFT_221755 [Emiliania huxleyi CCMP1516]|uniref:MMS19 nucleotide excision repair protein n=2 Tax=Emiliania huxleyi TaxID=2903 RepID=A0A0D3HY56_EMIH1|nr:hypothetical protein EMIHUDRAFT_221755 [Emiliania huxleyi CCMP1516]EOD03941.1 hypothetical protein EMIHUDRAFT_221755 [Emiliania huxleyi CCMP1516]|eukprot:XP_005756370.1 hypothetical protein EMIHUDRAFT_221755 [Emiliania huxleyi CCMP1516]
MPSYRGRERESALNALAGGVPVHPSSPRTTPGPLQRATAAHEAWLRTSAEGELCLYLSECFGSATPLAEQLGGLQIIAAVVNSAADDDDISGPSVLITNLANCLRVPLSSTEPSVLAAATLAFGRLARVGAAAEPVVAELRRALGRLSAGSKLDSATLVVREVALAAPSLLYVHVAAIFGSIWPAFRDARAAVRQSAAEALDAVLQIVAERPSAARGGWYAAARGEALTALRSGSAEAVHGGLLAAAALLSGGTPYDGKAPLRAASGACVERERAEGRGECR